MTILIQDAREHNLKGINVTFGDGLSVVTGVSGSGKTSLVFDTLYHEARRRFLEVYAIGSVAERLAPADVDQISGLGPAIAVGQNLLNRNPNSTLATASGLHPFLRLLYARFGERSCPSCDSKVSLRTEDEIVEQLMSLSGPDSITVTIPLVRQAHGSHRTLLDTLAKTFGANALRVDGRSLAPEGRTSIHDWALDPAVAHDIDLQIAIFHGQINATQARETVQLASSLGATALNFQTTKQVITLARTTVCPSCARPYGDLKPLHFRTNCPDCKGQGCSNCFNTGLQPQAAAVRWMGLRFPELLAKPVSEVRVIFYKTQLPTSSKRLISEIQARLEALDVVGLGYITLNRSSPTLSRGEAQRLRLAVALTSKLEDMVYFLDEPTIGQHPADVTRLLPNLRQLNGQVIYVEHDRGAAAVADQAVDLGPGAGNQGGQVLFSGSPADLWRADTPTGRFFSLRQRVALPEKRVKPDAFLTIHGANCRNLSSIDVPIPFSRLTVVTGVSGSGKSTLVEDVLVASLAQKRPIGCHSISEYTLKPVLVDQDPIGRNPRSNPATYTKLSDVVRELFANASPLSASHFSFNRPEGACSACLGMGALEVKMRYLPSTWIPCPACSGQRYSEEVLNTRVDLGEERLSIAELYRLSIAETLPLLASAKQLSESSRRKAWRILSALLAIGLGYLPLGQPSTTLSGGEAQRVKLAKFLGQANLHQRLIVLDEPTTGLHPQDIAGLLTVLDRLVRAEATIVVVEHNLDVIRAADWIIDLGPGAGPEGGQLLYAGPLAGLPTVQSSRTGKALAEEARVKPSPTAANGKVARAAHIAIRNARIHNLKGINVDIQKGALTVITGVSGSGKSSLINDVLANEARRRFLETLSIYERQATREGPESGVDTVTGLGVTMTVGPERRLRDQRATVGTATEIGHHLALMLASVGERTCAECGHQMTRYGGIKEVASVGSKWICKQCGEEAIAEPRHFNPTTYAVACQECHGVGTLRVPNPEKLIIAPEMPLCAGAMYSPGFFPKGFLCKPLNSGYDMVQALGERYGFDPATTPWNEMTAEAQHAFLFGDPRPLDVTFRSRNQTYTRSRAYPGFYGFIRDWDVGGTYTDSQICPRCQGARLRPEFLAVKLARHNIHELSILPLSNLRDALKELELDRRTKTIVYNTATSSLETVMRRLRYLTRVGLGYLHLDRPSSSLSAGEAQRIKLAALLGGGLTSLTILLDEPSRGLHPAEVNALCQVLTELRDEGNTVIVIEHDLLVINSADYLIDLGPGSGTSGGQIIAQGKPREVIRADTPTARWLRGDTKIIFKASRRSPQKWTTLCNPTAHNLHGEDIAIPLGVLVGVCGVSGSGKSTLMIDTLGRALAPKKYTTSVAQEPIDPGPFKSIENPPERTILVDQYRAGMVSPASYLNLDQPLRRLFAASDDAHALGITEKELFRQCSACNGRGAIKTDLGFLPPVWTPCETCAESGYLMEAWSVRLKGTTLPQLQAMTVAEVHDLFEDEETVCCPLATALEVGLGHLVLHQPGYALSGGEAQRLKIAKELCRKTFVPTLYILDEPTVGQHMEDVRRLIKVLNRLVDEGNSVAVVEHHPHLLAACDWLIELGPGGGPEGGRIIATGRPEEIAKGQTPTAPYLREILGVL